MARHIAHTLDARWIDDVPDQDALSSPLREAKGVVFGIMAGGGLWFGIALVCLRLLR